MFCILVVWNWQCNKSCIPVYIIINTSLTIIITNANNTKTETTFCHQGYTFFQTVFKAGKGV